MAQWNFDPTHSDASFSTRHMMVSTVRGNFTEISGTINFDPDYPEDTSVEAIIKTNSIFTGVEDRDNHLRSPDFFDASNYPEMTFKSTSVDVISDTKATLTGDLTIRGTTKPVILDVEYFGQQDSPFGDTRIGFEASTKINREDWGLTWNQALETGGFLVSKDVKISLDVEAVLVTEAQPA